MTNEWAIDHVQVAIPTGDEELARAFFGDFLGLTEIPKPADMAVRGGCWFAVGPQQLHIGVEQDFRAAKKAHVALATDRLAHWRARFDTAGIATFDEAPVNGRNRFFAHDPFGNRIEFIEGRS